MTTNILIDDYSRVGQMSAEADSEFLRSCFYEHSAYNIMANISDPRTLLIGSTGSGKTAIIKMIEERCANVSAVDLSEVAMNYINNSDAIAFLQKLDIDLSAFFKFLWRHVICLAYIKLKFNVDNETNSQAAFRKLKDYVGARDSNRDKALRYLELFEYKFWKTMDTNAIEITTKLVEDVTAELSSEIDKFKGSYRYVDSLSNEEKEHIVRRIQSFIDPVILSELAEVMNLLKDYDSNFGENLYITIDGVDENWVSGDIKYQMINSLIDSLKTLKKLDKLKVIVALRSDIFEKLIRYKFKGSFQSEKYEDYIYRLKWEKGQLRELIAKRINFLYRTKHHSDNVYFFDVFTNKVRADDSLNYMIARTLLRPRDVIDFTNECLKGSIGKNLVNATGIIKAEELYSERRYRSLVEEWQLTFPSIENIMYQTIRKKTKRFVIQSLNNAEYSNEILLAISQDDELFKMAEEIVSDQPTVSFQDFIKHILERLYIIGAVGLKISPESSVQWFHKRQEVFPTTSISDETAISVHPMLYEACKISDRRKGS